MPIRLYSLMFILVVLLVIDCSTHFSTLQQNDEKTRVIYQISEEEAFRLAHWALTSTFPNRKITIVDGLTRGYSTYFRIMLDTYSQQVLVFPAIGIKENKEEVKGYYFEVSGSGTTVIGRQKNVELFEKLNKSLAETGKSVVVTNVKLLKYEADMKIPIEGSQKIDKQSPSESLRELKQLHKEGIISDEEFEKKKKEILERM